METKANYVLIGLLTLGMSATIAFFIIWKTKGAFDQDYVLYDVVFNGSVSGLSEASFVQYNGIRIGNVRQISWEPDDPNKIRVRIRVWKSTPVKEDTIAQMVFQGVTGVTIVELSGGSGDSEPLLAKPGEEYPVITAKLSAIQELFEEAPDMISQVRLLVLQFHKLMSDENIQTVSGAFSDVKQVTGALAESDQEIKALLANVATVSSELAETSRRVNKITEDINGITSNAERIMSGEVPEMVGEITLAAQSIGQLAADADTFILENEDALTRFSSQGLAEFDEFVVDLRKLMATLERLSRRLESDPSMLVSGSQYPEVEVKK